MKIYELTIDFDKLKEQDDNFLVFKWLERFIDSIKKFIQNEKYSVSEEENVILFKIENELFENGVATIKIPEKK